VTKKVYAPDLIILLSAVCLTSIASAQTSWWRTYGGSADDGGLDVQQTSDGGYVVVGYTEGPGEHDVFIVKTDSAGDTLWTRTYGGSYYNEARGIRQTVDGGYIITGFAGNPLTADYDLYLIKTDAHGDTLWTRRYGGPHEDMGMCVRQTTDSGYIAVGHAELFGAVNYSVYLVRTDKNGDSLWTRTYGGAGDDEGQTVDQTADGGFIVAGTSGSTYLIRTTANGDTQWTRTYAGADFDEVGTELWPTLDGGYVLTGFAASHGDDVCLIKTGASGDTVWTRAYGGNNGDGGHAVQQTADGGYIVAGTTRSFGAGFVDVYLVKTDTFGDTLWTRTYGGTSYDEGYAVQQAADGGYIIAGRTSSFGAGNYDVYLIKTDSLGLAVAEPSPRHPLRPTRFLVQPNPFTSFARVPGHETEVFVLSDVTGRQVAVCKGDRVGEGLRPGVYFLSPAKGDTSSGKPVTTTIIKAAP
jgi:hypothetical protein